MPYLVECLESIRNQTVDNWELLAVNDHSSDESNEILANYSLKDPRISVFQNKNNGIIDALQTGYFNSKGNYITRMDADDIMPPNKLELMHNELSNSDEKTLVTGYVEYFSEQGVGPGFTRYQEWLNSLVDQSSHHKEMYKECVIPSPCWMTTRKAFDKSGGFDSDIYPEDYDLVFRFHLNGVKFKPIKELLHLWRDHSTRTSRTHEHYAINSFLKLKIGYFLKLDYNPVQQLIVWGAGKKGKQIALLLNEANIPFEWVCNNPNKIGVTLHGKVWRDSDTWFQSNESYQAICTVSKPEDQERINYQIKNLGNIERYWFC